MEPEHDRMLLRYVSIFLLTLYRGFRRFSAKSNGRKTPRRWQQSRGEADVAASVNMIDSPQQHPTLSMK